MLFADTLVVVRGGGDLGTGVAWRLNRSGFPVAVTDLAAPLAIRRAVAVSSAVTEGSIEVEGLQAVRCESPGEALALAGRGAVPVLVDDGIPPLGAAVIVDARMRKRAETRPKAPFVVGLGPGFAAGVHCDAVVETQRGHRLGRVIWEGSAAADTGVPGELGGARSKRVIRAEAEGSVRWDVSIGDLVEVGDVLGHVGGETAVVAEVGGVVRGLLAPATPAVSGLKIADIDPRGDRGAAFEVSEKALAIGGGVLEAILSWQNR